MHRAKNVIGYPMIQITLWPISCEISFLKNPTDSLLILLAFRKFPQEAMKNSRDFWIWKENVDFYDVKHLFVCHKEL